MNWKKFELKYDKKENWAFEQMAYLLFCSEFNNRIGIFRYKNQAGIETNPIEHDGKLIGFQAKYYTNSISESKDDIIDSIRKAKSKNPKLTDVFFYVNQELSESSKKNEKAPKYQKEIEKVSSGEGIKLHWRVPSHFELQLALPENQYINELFFSIDSSVGDLIDEIYKHNKKILSAIRTEILFHDKVFKIDRSVLSESIVDQIKLNKNIIISGEGGCGKTAIFKEFYEQNIRNFPIAVFKANELNVKHINDIFHLENHFTFSDFLNAFDSEIVKVFVIDSAEKLAEISNNEILFNLISSLSERGWCIIFTTRYSYINDLTFHIKENYKISYKVIDIPLVDRVIIENIFAENEFLLPDNSKFVERLRNLFYLNEYIEQYSSIDKQGSFSGFIKLLWKKRIQNNVITKDNLHRLRESCLIDIVKMRCNTGRFYVNDKSLSDLALFNLTHDEIISFDDVHNGYFITHDIYEEWALDMIVSQSFANHQSISDFFSELGDSLPIRRAFRLWLSERLYESKEEIKKFVKEAFICNELSQFWKDELLISVLLSDFSETFFEFFENEIIANDFEILKRILFLLRIACTDISSVENFETIKPKGRGWQETIALMFKHKSSFFENNLKIILPFLSNWCNYNKTGKTTKLSGLLALGIIQKTETVENFYMHQKAEENILNVIFNASNELKEELTEIFDKVVANQWSNHNDPYEGLCSMVLEKPYVALGLINNLPKCVINICEIFWKHKERSDNRFGFSSYSMESKYGITEKHSFKYFPASANQTPIRWLLYSNFHDTLDFIINFTNNAVESYRISDYGEDVVEIILNIDGKEIKQYVSNAIWNMYRGSGSPVVPNLLQSIHMALEKVLLEFAKELNAEELENILKNILLKSKSASLTAIVCSLVLAFPEKCYKIALFLFRTIEFFHIDNNRKINEFQTKSLYGIGYGMNKISDAIYTDERLKTCEDQHRNISLENLFLNYQFTGVKGFTEDQNDDFIQKIFKIIDDFKSNSEVNEFYGILLARMDRRNLDGKITEETDNGFIIEFTPKQLSDELKLEIEETKKEYDEVFKYSPLHLWSDFISNERNPNKNNSYQKFDNDPLLALNETKQLLKDLKEGKNTLGIIGYSTPSFVCSKLLIEHIDCLDVDDRQFCKEVVDSTIFLLLSDEYEYQISDGVEACIRAIPALIFQYPEEKEFYISTLVTILFDKHSIGAYKRICDYVIESIHKSKLWEEDYEVTQAVLLGYISIQPIFKNLVNEKTKNRYYGERVSKRLIFDELEKRYSDTNFLDLVYDANNLNLLDIHDLEIVYQLLPSATKDKIHLDIFSKTLPKVAPILLKDRRNYKKEFGEDSEIHFVRLQIFRKFASFILEREHEEIQTFIDPFINEISLTEETASFIEEIVGAQDKLNHYNNFWRIWRLLYSKIKELSSNSKNYFLQNIIINYFLAWRWWREGVEDWHSLRNDNLQFFLNASNELGHIPSFLYSVSRVLNTIGSKFTNEGIDWIYAVIHQNKSLDLGDLEGNTLYYLENLLRKSIFVRRKEIKEEIKLKNRIIPILDFMVERGSIHAYLLRESVL